MTRTLLRAAVLATAAVLVGLGSAQATVRAQEAPYTAADVEALISAYSVRYSSEAYPYTRLVRDATRIAWCESGGFDPQVVNNVRRGRLGEVGVGQFLPSGIWWLTPQADAGYSMFDPEANIAALVWSVAHGYGPRHWVACW